MDDSTFKPTVVDPYEGVLYVEEIFLYIVVQLEWLAAFVASKKKTHMIIANGDPSQNEPPTQELTIPFDAYYDEVMTTIFPRHLELVIAKRYTDEDSALKWLLQTTASFG